MGGIRQASEQRPVTLSASIGMTGLWLLPRLGQVQKLHPGVDVRVSSNNRVADLRNEGIDLAIRYTTPALAPAGAQRLFGETLAPVAHPSLGLRSLDAGALSGLCLLVFDDPQHPWLRWSDWLAAVGWADAKPQAVLHFNQYDQLIQAALAGQGVALGRLELIQPLLDDKRLVRVAAPTPAQPSGHAYWLIHAQEAPREDVRHVAAWLMDEARQSSGH